MATTEIPGTWRRLNWNEYKGFREYGVQPRAAGNQRTKARQKYINDIFSFDTETTRLAIGDLPEIKERKDELAFIYVWMFADYNQRVIYYGRTLDDFIDFLELINGELDEMGDDTYIVVWVHNLSYEFQFLSGATHFESNEVVCIDKRKVLQAKYKHIEFRCSYLHCNMSLDEWANKMGVAHKKESGEEFDYGKKRYPWTELSALELTYTDHDVIAVCECLDKEMQTFNDNLYTIPLTSTGYVRRDVKRALHEVTWIKQIQPDFTTVQLLRKAFRGGDTHANRYFAAQVLTNVKSADRSSSYPEVQINHLFPVSSWKKADTEYFEQVLNTGKPFLATITFESIELKDTFEPIPYLAFDKCENCKNVQKDNGRILSADKITTTIVDIDFDIICKQYKWKLIDVSELFVNRYGQLPEPMKDCIREYYTRKTELKGVRGEEIYYHKAKNKLNAIYGMTAQNPIKGDILYIDNDYVEQTYMESDWVTDKKRQFITYTWGVYTTAWARWELQQGIQLVKRTHGAYVIYCDTDSVKYIESDKTVEWNKYNTPKERISAKNSATAVDPKGNRHYMGIFEYDGFYPEFATLGAKKYAYTDEKGDLHVTIAGVSKKKGGKELAKGDAYGKGLERFVNLEPPFKFVDAGGTEILYKDIDPYYITIDGHPLKVGKCAVIRESEYTLGITAEYDNLLKGCNLVKW